MDKLPKWTAADPKPNSPITGKHVEDGLAVARLCEAVIPLSDNTAADALLKQIGGPAGLTTYFRTPKGPISCLDRRRQDRHQAIRPARRAALTRRVDTPAGQPGVTGVSNHVRVRQPSALR
ncbi:serine hydrolase [Streptosporangium canum]|uniref:serine hydrolase n=1 Tax=Streptosporangium canum TaxID=324952 RepID=UPI00379DDDDE